MTTYEIVFYEKSDGTEPVKDFIMNLLPKMQAKTIRILDILQEFGPDLRMPYSKMLRDGIYQIRIIQGNNCARVLYFFTCGNKIILTNGFIKKTQKTPGREIEIAQKYRKDYERRNKNDQL